MKTMALWLIGIVGILVIAGFVALSLMAGSPKDALYMLRYALPHMHRGKLRPGDTAPDARLLALNGKDYFHLRERTSGGRPLMVVFGSYTWPPFRRQVGDIVKIYNDYKDHADFLTVYVREAHPTDEWQMKSNVKEDVCYAQPKTLEQRIAIANDFVQRLKYPVPFGIDDMTNAANDAYSAWPERIYIIDESGHIAYAGGMGPFNYRPEEARAWLASRFGEVAQPAPATPAYRRDDG